MEGYFPLVKLSLTEGMKNNVLIKVEDRYYLGKKGSPGLDKTQNCSLQDIAAISDNHLAKMMATGKNTLWVRIDRGKPLTG